MNKELEKKLVKMIEGDLWMIDILNIVRDLKLQDCWVGAGFVRNKVWDEIHGKSRTKLNDIDVIYFDKLNTTKEYDLHLEYQLKSVHPNLNWSVKNQARMHDRNGHKEYNCCSHAITHWPETATSIAVRLTQENRIEYIAPYGLEDLFNLLVVPTPEFDLKIYKERVKKKKWTSIWSELKVKTSYTTTPKFTQQSRHECVIKP